jgi:hypothetical protein
MCRPRFRRGSLTRLPAARASARVRGLANRHAWSLRGVSVDGLAWREGGH